MPKNKSWYNIQASADGTDATIYVYDEISAWGVSAKQFCDDLNGITASNINLRLNSPGGNVFDGVTIHNALKSHKASINVQVDGLAASIASVIAMAGDKITMAQNAMMMIHNAWSLAIGNATELRKTADVLDKIDGTLVNTYSERTGAGKRSIKQMMNDETWMTADEALKMGFCDQVGEQKDVKASFDLSKFGNTPAAALAMYGMPKELTERDKEQLLRDAGFSQRQAKVALAAIKGNHRDDDPTEAQVAARIASAASEYKTITAIKGE